VKRFMLLVVPVPENGEKLKVPFSLRRYRGLVEELLRSCDRYACSTWRGGRRYPDYYAPERCMVVERGERHVIVYVRELEQRKPEEERRGHRK
jgi:hypothetical protein